MRPTPDQALQFAIMVTAGIPPREALTYFTDAQGADFDLIFDGWCRSREYSQALLKLQGKAFQDMTLEERIQWSLNKTYTEMAYFLHSHNYSELEGALKTKADTCRQVLENKQAGMAGQLNVLSQFWADMAAGKFAQRLNQSTPEIVKWPHGFPTGLETKQ